MSTTTTENDVQAWLVARIVAYGKKAAGDFSVDTDFSEIGLDSVYALTLCGDIEDEYDIEIDPEIMWDYSTIRTLAARLEELGA
ncbi:acyl carrier protein [Microbacterium allomyrinae]|uniref:Acyl carrier protein n=1 Tax=Microbacterium allomyrinae TaxID=2830666 RepID=A0A9X1S4B4_9MICO|nr:acyl carrier protein [Microbacterium allomyrinae]MCC2034079.1 acyl carrier protein [Microbacterium allomyrinae]